jgi:post-segregation antitoxin (ccd killing protein)
MPSDANAMTQKGNVVLYLDKELVEKSKELGFNLSKTFENHLKHLITQFSTSNSMNNCNSASKIDVWWAGPDSDRRPSARQADVLTKLDDRPTVLVYFLCFLIYSYFAWEVAWCLNLGFVFSPRHEICHVAQSNT